MAKAYDNKNGDDFEKISVSSNTGHVWKDRTNNRWSVKGFRIAQQGQHVIPEGATSGSTSNLFVHEPGVPQDP